ncbi:MAG: hypothetical protein IT384_10600 [Deltaproteobacteria bacterium]|nr:hypothetical protein [Deltaproteobacteria bacterium]
MRRLIVTMLALGSSCSCDPLCDANQALVDGECRDRPPRPNLPNMTTIPGPCDPGGATCFDAEQVARCSADGTSARLLPCAGNDVCEGGRCVTPCTPGMVLGCASALELSICGDDGLTRTATACPAGTLRCVGLTCRTTTLCTPGDVRCDNDTLVACSLDGWSESRTRCQLGCDGRRCVAPPSSQDRPDARDGEGPPQGGLEFFAVKLDTLLEFGPRDLTLVIWNPNDGQAHLRLEDGRGQSLMATVSVSPHSVDRVDLPMVEMVEATSLTSRSVRITSDVPVVIQQYLPFDNLALYSNDGSLLASTDSGGTEHLGLGWRTVPIGIYGDLHAYLTIVATQPETTEVRIDTPSATLGANGVPAIPAGSSRVFRLAEREVLSLGAADVAGMRIQSDQPVRVFSGSRCTHVPDLPDACDHLEEQLLPLDRWAHRYVAAKFAPRGTEPDLYRVVAGEAGTVLRTDPPIVGLDGVALDAGQLVEVTTDQDFVISSNGRFAVAQLMVGEAYLCESNLGCAIPPDPSCRVLIGNQLFGGGLGDPAMLFLVAGPQWRSEYQILVPEGFAENHVSVIAARGVDVRIGTERIPLQPIGGSAYGAGRELVTEGAHTVTATAPFALYVYGYDCAVSYAVAAGAR